MFNCDQCGSVDYVLMNGYNFGDRILEDVYFELRQDENGELSVTLCEGQNNYCKQLNMTYWLEKAHEFVKGHDFAECPKCREDVTL